MSDITFAKISSIFETNIASKFYDQYRLQSLFGVSVQFPSKANRVHIVEHKGRDNPTTPEASVSLISRVAHVSIRWRRIRHHVEQLEKDVACKANLPSDSTMAGGGPYVPCTRDMRGLASLSTCGLQ